MSVPPKPKPITLDTIRAELRELGVQHTLTLPNAPVGWPVVSWTIGGKVEAGMAVDLAAGIGYYAAESTAFGRLGSLAMMLPVAEPWAWERLGWLLASPQAAVGREGWGRHRDRSALDVRPVPIPLVPEMRPRRASTRIVDFKIATIT